MNVDLKLFFTKNLKKFSFLSYFLAFIWIILISLPIKYLGLNHHTYISENALLPGLVEEQYQTNNEDMASIYNNLYRTYNSQLKGVDNCTSRINELTEKVYQTLSYMKIEAYKQHFYFKVAQNECKGTNIYAIKRASKTPNYDGIILYTSISHFPKITSHLDFNNLKQSIDLATPFVLLSLMQHLTLMNKDISWISKDIILLISSHDMYGPLAWMLAYNKNQNYLKTSFFENSIFLNYDDLVSSRPNYIQAALCLRTNDLNTSHANLPKFSHIRFQSSGINGRLSNLDFLNIAHQIAAKGGIITKPKNYDMEEYFNAKAMRIKGFVGILTKYLPNTRFRRWFEKSMGNLINSFNRDLLSPTYNLLTSILELSTGFAMDKSHAVFSLYGIDSISAEISAQGSGETGADYRPKFNSRKLCRFIEGMVRSLNNLQEKFHQSYFFYLMTSSDRFVSIASYYPAFVLLSLPLILHCLQLWQLVVKSWLKKQEMSSGDGKNRLSLSEIKVHNVWKPILVNHLVGLTIYNALKYCFEIVSFTRSLVKIDNYTLALYGSIAIATIFAFNFMTRKNNNNKKEGEEIPLPEEVTKQGLDSYSEEAASLEYSLPRLIVTLEMTLGLYALSLFNYSLALSLVLVLSSLVFCDFCPLEKAKKPELLRNAKNIMILLLSFPLSILFLHSLLSFSQNHSDEVSLQKVIQNDMLNLLVSDRLFNSQNLKIYTLFCMPVWLFYCQSYAKYYRKLYSVIKH